MIRIIDSEGKTAGEQDDAGTIIAVATPEGERLREWLRNGVPGLRGKIEGEIASEIPSIIKPEEPLFGLALLEHFDEIGWTTHEVQPAA